MTSANSNIEAQPNTSPVPLPTQARAVSVVLGLIGLTASLYTIVHFLAVKAGDPAAFACNINDYFSCDKVALSPYSEFFNIPLGVWGMGFFAAIMGLALMAGKRPKPSLDVLHALFALSAIGAIAAVSLVGLSTMVIGAVCIACTVSHLAAVALFLYYAKQIRYFALPLKLKSTVNGGWAAGFIVAVFVLGYQFFQPGPKSISEEELSRVIKSDGQFVLDKKADLVVDRSQYSGYGLDFRLGPEDAKVEIVEFADLQCPACKHVGDMLKKVQEANPTKVALVFKNYPLDGACNASMKGGMHPFACLAATLARCGDTHDYFWRFSSLVFENQDKISEPMLKDIAAKLSVPAAKIESCIASKSIREKIVDDIAMGNKLGINATPTIYINQQKYVGPVNFVAMSAEVNRFIGQ